MKRDIKTKAKACVWLYSVGFILGMLAHIMTTCKLVMHGKEFLTYVQVCKWQQSIKGARRGYFNTTEILPKGNLEFLKLCIWPDKVIGTTKNLQLSLPYQGHFKYSADFKGIVLKPQRNLEEFRSNFQHFRKHYEYFASKLLLTSQHFFNLVLCFAKRAPCYFSSITVLESRCPLENIL